MVCAAWATTAATGISSGVGAKDEFASVKARVERLKYSRLFSRDAAICSAVMAFLLGRTKAGYLNCQRKKNEIINICIGR